MGAGGDDDCSDMGGPMDEDWDPSSLGGLLYEHPDELDWDEDDDFDWDQHFQASRELQQPVMIMKHLKVE